MAQRSEFVCGQDAREKLSGTNTKATLHAVELVHVLRRRQCVRAAHQALLFRS